MTKQLKEIAKTVEKGTDWLGLAGLTTGLVGTVANLGMNLWTQKKNINMQEQQLQYQKWLNANQQQLQVADAQKAGINPLAMNGGTVQAGSYSNVQPAQMDNSGILSMIESMIGAKTQRDIANEQAETQKQIAEIQHRTAIDVANINAETTKSEGQANRSAQKTIEDNKNELNKLIAKNNLEQKEAESLRNIAFNIDKFNAELTESYNANETQYQNYVDNMKRELWNAYKEEQYGIATSSLYSALTEYLVDKSEALGNSIIYSIKELFGLNNEKEGKKGQKRSRLSWEEYEQWFKNNVEPNIRSKAPTKTADIAQSSDSWSWNQ